LLQYDLHRETSPVMRASISQKWKYRQMPGSFDRFRELPLVNGAHPADSARQDLPPLRVEVGKKPPVFEIDIGNLFGAKLAHSLAPDRESSRCSTHGQSTPFLYKRADT